MPGMQTIEHRVSESIQDFLRTNFLGAYPDRVVAPDERLLDGIIDSMGVLELLSYIEEAHGVRVDDHEVTDVNLGSIAAIARFVASKGAA
jgi:acyl carrier protein